MFEECRESPRTEISRAINGINSNTNEHDGNNVEEYFYGKEIRKKSSALNALNRKRTGKDGKAFEIIDDVKKFNPQQVSSSTCG
jgi:hypothetical protein